jgi:hypothetical protein
VKLVLLLDELGVNGRAEILPAYRRVTPGGLRNVRKVGGTRHCANHIALAADPIDVA